jgi:hypothetical protein
MRPKFSQLILYEPRLVVCLTAETKACVAREHPGFGLVETYTSRSFDVFVQDEKKRVGMWFASRTGLI